MTWPAADVVGLANVYAANEPLLARAGRIGVILAALREAGFTISDIDCSTFIDDRGLLEEIARRLPMPYGTLPTWDAFRDYFEDFAGEWSVSLLLVCRNYDALLTGHVGYALRLPLLLSEVQGELRAHGTRIRYVIDMSREVRISYPG